MGLGIGGNVCAFVFAFQGQSMFLEIMREMKLPRRFGRSVVGANMVTPQISPRKRRLEAPS